MMRRGSWTPLLLALLSITLVALGEDTADTGFNTFTAEWEAKYNKELRTSSEACVTCAALLPFGVPKVGKEHTCISHCELLVPPGSPDSECEMRCWKVRAATFLTKKPCEALGACPLPLPYAAKYVMDLEDSHFRPVVVIRGSERSDAFVDRMVEYIRFSFEGIHVRELSLTGGDAEEESGFRLMRPIHAQVERACEILELDPNLAKGFDLLAFDHGGLVARGYVQMCNAPPVRVLITYNTPHGGTYSPGADTPAVEGLPALPDDVGPPPEGAYEPYSPLAQAVSSAAGAYLDPTDRAAFVRNCSFLPDANLHRTSHPDAEEFAAKLGSLEKLLLLYAPQDKATSPESSPWFQSFSERADGAVVVHPLFDTPVYASLGLETLDLRDALLPRTLPKCSYEEPPSMDETVNFGGCRKDLYENMLTFLGTTVMPSVRRRTSPNPKFQP